jgi:hypothetical protein
METITCAGSCDVHCDGDNTCDNNTVICSGPECRFDCCQSSSGCSNNNCSGSNICDLSFSPCP